MCILEQVNCQKNNGSESLFILKKILQSQKQQIEKRNKRYLGIQSAAPTFWFDMTQQSGYIFPHFFGRKANDTSKTDHPQSYFSYYFNNFYNLLNNYNNDNYG
jgi:hypothetical protein